ncbi:MAG TPA: hypothetical protein VL326_36885 [Kofleriaceae bacterium]|nr:hypothetical protein [Kofleriaceae bacterium]
MSYAEHGGVRHLGRFVGRLLGDELAEIHASGSPTAELFAITSRAHEGFAISRHADIETAERACLAPGVIDRAVIRIGNEDIVMLVASGAAATAADEKQKWAAECMLGYVADDDTGIATSHLHVEGELVSWRQQLVSSIVEGMASRREIKIGRLGDFGADLA